MAVPFMGSILYSSIQNSNVHDLLLDDKKLIENQKRKYVDSVFEVRKTRGEVFGSANYCTFQALGLSLYCFTR